ncbi:hypothetical protein BC828DRAFT_407815, partial [Blastocladiella britannica]
DIVHLRNASRTTRNIATLPSGRPRRSAKLAALAGDPKWYLRALAQMQHSTLIRMQVNDDHQIWITLATAICDRGYQTMLDDRTPSLVLAAALDHQRAWTVLLLVKRGAGDPAFTFDLVLVDIISEPERVCTVAAALAATGNAFASTMAETLLTKLHCPRWTADWAGSLVTKCLIEPSTSNLRVVALDLLSAYLKSLPLSQLTPPTLRDNLVAAVTQSFPDPAACTKDDAKLATALARILALIFHTPLTHHSGTYDSDADGAWRLVGVVMGEVHPNGGNHISKKATRRSRTYPAIGHLLGRARNGVANVAIAAGAHTLLLHLVRSRSMLSRSVRCSVLEALLTWASSGRNTNLLYNDPDLVRDVTALVDTKEPSHSVLDLTDTLLRRLVARLPITDPNLAGQLMSAITTSTATYCDSDPYLRSVKCLASASSKSRRLDLLVALVDKGLGPWLAHTNNRSVRFRSAYEQEDMLSVICSYQLSGVESHWAWSRRQSVRKWYDKCGYDDQDAWDICGSDLRDVRCLLLDLQRSFGTDAESCDEMDRDE